MEETIDACLPCCCCPEDVVTIYGALSTYLKILVQQPQEDLETIARVTRLIITIKPRAVEASKSLSLKAAGMEAVDAKSR